MSPDIIIELDFLRHSFLIGIWITVLYDLLRILRQTIPHSLAAISVEDFLYWVCSSFWIFRMLIRENNGVLRWFAVAGAFAGMILYKKTIGNFFVKYISRLFCRILHLVAAFFGIVFRPLNLVRRRLSRIGKKPGKWLKMGIRRAKKKLTRSKKLLKIILCKQ